MKDNNPIRPYEINLRVLFFQVLSHWRSIVIGALLVAAAMVALRVNWAASAAGTSGPIEGGDHDPFADTQRQVDALARNVESLDQEIAMTEDRLANAPLFQINPNREWVSAAELVIRQQDKTRAHSLDGLVSAYTHALCRGEYLTPLAEELGMRRAYLEELISVESGTSLVGELSLQRGKEDPYHGSYTVNGETWETAVIRLKVIAPEQELADRIAGAAEEALLALPETLSDQILPHSMEILSRESFETVDAELAAMRNKTYSLLRSTRSERTDRSRELDSAAGALAEARAAAVQSGESRLRSAVKNGVIGAVLGAFLLVLYWCLRLLLGRRFESVEQFYGRYNLNRLGTLPLDEKRFGRRSGAVDRWILSQIGDYTGEDEERSLSLAAANIAAFAGEGKRLVLTGCGTPEKLSALGRKLEELLPGCRVTAAPDFQNNENAVKVLGGAEAVILAEERRASRYEQINRELAALQALDKPVVGSIIL